VISLPPFLRRSRTAAPIALPPDPRAALADPIDPLLLELRGAVLPHRRRLWLRRLVRRAWIALAVVVAAELLLWTLARFVPMPAAPLVGAALPLLGLFGWLVESVRARPGLGETALAVDLEGRLGDRVSSAFELAVEFPASAGPDERTSADEATPEVPLTERAETDRFVRRQRRDALATARLVPPGLFAPRFSRQPAAAALVAALLLAPVLFLPNPQDIVIAQQQQLKEAAERQAERIDRVAEDLESKGEDANDPRTQLAEELRELALRLREHPEDLDANLARLGTIEDEVRAQIDPANEQRAASLASLSRQLSRAATGSPEANKDGDPEETREDLAGLAEELDEMTPEEQRDLARELAELEATASQADGAAGAALSEAAQSLAQGDTAGARSALDRLGESLTGADQRITAGRDLASAASRLQDARRDLANAGRPAQGQGQGQGQAQQSPGASPGTGQGQGQGQQSPGASPGTGQGQGQGQGQGSGQGQGQGQGAIGGGGSNARSLGSGLGGNARPGAPTGANRAAELGDDLSSVFAPFDRLGRPGDPSYVAGTGGDGQTQQGNQTDSGTNNGVLTPYQQVYADFERYAQQSLDRGYIPLSVKDFVRNYFSSLNPSN
jgi:hypothetical protein